MFLRLFKIKNTIMSTRFVLAIIFSFSFLIIPFKGNVIHGQSKIDSIVSEVKALNLNYKQRLSELYHEMLIASFDREVPGSERYKSRLLYYLFPIEENMNRLLDSIDTKEGSINNNFKEEYPYWANFGKMMYENNYVYPALMSKVLARLEKPQIEKRLFLFSLYFQGFFSWIGGGSMDEKEQAACLRIIANSMMEGAQRRHNLLKIADILEKR